MRGLLWGHNKTTKSRPKSYAFLMWVMLAPCDFSKKAWQFQNYTVGINQFNWLFSMNEILYQLGCSHVEINVLCTLCKKGWNEKELVLVNGYNKYLFVRFKNHRPKSKYRALFHTYKLPISSYKKFKHFTLNSPHEILGSISASSNTKTKIW